MSDLVETRWTRYGKNRVYVRDSDGVELGYLDLQANTAVPANGEHAATLLECLTRWTHPGTRSVPAVAGSPCGEAGATLRAPVAAPWPSPNAAADEQTEGGRVTSPCDAAPAREPAEWDLAYNVAGAAAQVKRDEINAQAPVANFFKRVFGMRTEERTWRVGAEGEVRVARELSRLGSGWHTLHAIPVGEQGSDIDHVVIGPGGVFSLNTKCRPNGKAWVGEHRIIVNGQCTDYLRNSRFEGRRASRPSSRPQPSAAITARYGKVSTRY